MSSGDPHATCQKLGQFDLYSQFYRPKFTFPMGTRFACNLKGFSNKILFNMPNYYPYQGICTIPTIWPWPISQGHCSRFRSDFVKIEVGHKSSRSNWSLYFCYTIVWLLMVYQNPWMQVTVTLNEVIRGQNVCHWNTLVLTWLGLTTSKLW